MRNLSLTLGIVLATAAVATAQTTPPAGSASGGVKVAVYPVMAFVPLGIEINVDLPPFEGGGGGGGDIIDSRFDGAFLGGFYVAAGAWRVDANGLWAAIGGDRLELPALTVDIDAVYFHATGGRRIVKDFYLTAGVRRLALNYNIKLGDRPNFERTPGIWDPLVGLGWHSDANPKLETHAAFEVGGFGVGTDLEVGGSFRLDWKPVRHFGLTAGYHLLYFKLEHDVLSSTFTVKQTLHGPIVGIGFYF